MDLLNEAPTGKLVKNIEDAKKAKFSQPQNNPKLRIFKPESTTVP